MKLQSKKYVHTEEEEDDMKQNITQSKNFKKSKTTNKNAKTTKNFKKTTNSRQSLAEFALAVPEWVPGANLLSLIDGNDPNGDLETARRYVLDVLIPHMPGVEV